MIRRTTMTEASKKALEVLAAEKREATNALFDARDGKISAEDANGIIRAFNAAFLGMGGEHAYTVVEAV